MRRCFFIGHRDSPETLSQIIYDAVERHIVEFGISEFLVGHYGSFDRMATHAVIAAKRRHPHIRLTLLLPYHPSLRPVELADGFDGSDYPPQMEKVPMRAAIVRANRYAVEQSNHLILPMRVMLPATPHKCWYTPKSGLKKGCSA